MLLLDQLLEWIPRSVTSLSSEVRIRSNIDPKRPNTSREPFKINNNQGEFKIKLDKWTMPQSLPSSFGSGDVVEIPDERMERTKRAVDAKRDDRIKRRRTEEGMERTERTVEQDERINRRRTEEGMERTERTVEQDERIQSEAATLAGAFEHPEVKEEVPDWDPSDLEAPEPPSPISVSSSEA
jgi:hypothetical protein